MNAAGRFLVAMPVLALLAASAAYAWRSGEAESLAFDAHREMAAWAAAGGRPAPDTVASIRSTLGHAAALSPRDPGVQELLGSVLAYDLGDAASRAAAPGHLARALELRPTSPYTWAQLARVLYDNGDTGARFEAALRNAARLGPAEAEVQRTVVDLGLAVRDEVAPATRISIDSTVAAAMRRNPLATLQIAERRGRLAVACRYLDPRREPQDPKGSLVCSREATT